MDKIQVKLVELANNLTALEICLSSGRMDYSDLILYLQYDMPLESNNEEYAALKRTFCNLHSKSLTNFSDRAEALTNILRRLQEFIIEIDKNGSQAQVVYKEANDVAEQICSRLQTQIMLTTRHKTVIRPIVPYSEKAAL